MTREDAQKWLDEIVNEHLLFNDDVDWKPSAVDALLKLLADEAR